MQPLNPNARSAHKTQLRRPPNEATPDEVREYLRRVLQNRGMPQSRACHIAAKWTVGCGKQLQSYPVEMYRELFGSGEELWAVYVGVTSQIYREADETTFSLSLNVRLFLVGAIALATATLALFAFGLKRNDFWMGLSLISMLPAFLSVPFIMAGLAPYGDPEDRAEAELRSVLFKRKSEEISPQEASVKTL